MRIKDLIEAVKFQVSVKPQDEFMAEVAEGLEKLYEENNRQKAEIERLNTLCQEQNIEIERLREAKEQLEAKTSEEIHSLCAEIRKLNKTNDSYTEECNKLLSLIQKARTEAIKEFAERLKEKFSNLEYVINSSRKTIPIQIAKAEVDAVLQNGCSNVIDSVRKEMEVD